MVPVESVNDFDLLGGKCPKHPDYPVDSLCKDCICSTKILLIHLLCCLIFLALCCLKCKWEEAHKGHDVIYLNESKPFLKDVLVKHNEVLERVIPVIEKIPQEAKQSLKNSQEKREAVKEMVMQKFNEIRKSVDTKESEILSNLEGDVSCDDRLVKLISNAQTNVKGLIAAASSGKNILGKWEATEVTQVLAHNVVCIIGKAKEASQMKNEYDDVCDCDVTFGTSKFEKMIDSVTASVTSTEVVHVKRVSFCEPRDFSTNEIGPFYVSLKWVKTKDDTECTVSVQSDNSNREFNVTVGSEGSVIVNGLSPDTVYKVASRVKRGDIVGKWSHALIVKTIPATTEKVLTALVSHWNDAVISLSALKELDRLLNEGKYKCINTKFCLFVPTRRLRKN